MKTGVWTVLILLSLLVAAAVVAFWGWRQIDEVEISGHGLIALALGIILSFAVGAGLMTLVFFSSRRGYDDEAWGADRTRERHAHDPEDEA